MKTIDELVVLIDKWHDDRLIVPNSTPAIQALKMFSEAGELADNIIKGRDVKDDIGDVIVCLCAVARLSGTTIQECMTEAYLDIADRKGTTLDNGTFIKE